MMTDIRESFKHGVSTQIRKELPGLTKAAHEMVVEDIMSSIENNEALKASLMLQGEGHEKSAGLWNKVVRLANTPYDRRTLGQETLSELASTAGGLLLAGGAGVGIHSLLQARKNSELINQYEGFQNVLASVSKRNPLLSNESPERIKDLGNSIFKFAPTVANDPLVLETVMSNAIHGGGLDPQTVRSLQELEERYHKLREVEAPKTYIV
jgi:hypothetical protein